MRNGRAPQSALQRCEPPLVPLSRIRMSLHFFEMAHRSWHRRAHYAYSRCELNNGRWSFRERERGFDNGSQHADDVHQGERARFEGERGLRYRAPERGLSQGTTMGVGTVANQLECLIQVVQKQVQAYGPGPKQRRAYGFTVVVLHQLITKLPPGYILRRFFVTALECVT